MAAALACQGDSYLKSVAKWWCFSRVCYRAPPRLWLPHLAASCCVCLVREAAASNAHNNRRVHAECTPHCVWVEVSVTGFPVSCHLDRESLKILQDVHGQVSFIHGRVELLSHACCLFVIVLQIFFSVTLICEHVLFYSTFTLYSVLCLCGRFMCECATFWGYFMWLHGLFL